MLSIPLSRPILVAALTIGVLGATAAPAAAHGINSQPIPDAAHYLTSVTALSPHVSGLTVRVDPRGQWISVTNGTQQPLTVLGYMREPYILVDKSGVAENVYSASYQLNQSLFGDINQLGATDLLPYWQRVSSGRTARWHDHRIHWMSAVRPPTVAAHPDHRVLIGRWQIHLRLGATPVTISGELSWLPIKSSNATTAQIVIWTVNGAAILVALAVFALYALRRRRAAAQHDHEFDLTDNATNRVEQSS